MSEEVDYEDLVERICDDVGINDISDEVKGCQETILENRAISDNQYETLLEQFNRVVDRLDIHIENQSTKPMREVDELKRWMKEYLDFYIRSSKEQMESNQKMIKDHHTEIYGNGKKGLRTEIESLKTKATITLWLVGIMLTGGGLSAGALVIWRILLGG